MISSSDYGVVRDSRLVGLIIAVCVLQAVGALCQATPDAPTGITADDVLAEKLWHIAAATNTRIGFEATDRIRPDSRRQAFLVGI